MANPSPSSLLSAKTLRFDVFELDLEAQQLRKAGALVRLQPHPFKVLAALARHAQQIVTREELRREVWGDQTFVDFEQGLNFCIRQIRTVLGDEAQTPRYIETIPRRGYRFIAMVDGTDTISRPEIEPAQGPLARRLRQIPRWAFAVSIPLLVALIATAVIIRSSAHPALSEKDAILITDFANSTDDPIFDGTLRCAVSVDLAQSPYLNIVSDDKVRQALRLMNKPTDARITAEIGREICQRNGIKAMLTGSIATLGNRYLMILAVVNASSGDTLAQEQAQANSKEQILGALSKSDDKLRKQLGESLASIQQFGKPLEQVTTSSFEALQLYVLGQEKRAEGEYNAIPFFQRAIQLDPSFADAHAALGTVYLNLEQLHLAEEYEKRALALSDRVSERERLYITAHYYILIGQRDKALLTYETYSRLYPHDGLPENNLANEYNLRGRFDKGLEHARKALQLNPDNVSACVMAAWALESLGRIDEAKAVVNDTLRLVPDSHQLHLELSNIALAQGDTAARNHEDAVLRATPNGKLDLLYRDAALAAARGRLREAQELYSQTVEMALSLDLKDNASFAMALRAVYEAYLGKASDAKASVKTALKLSQMSDTIEPAAVSLAAAGGGHQAETLIDNLAKERPEDTTIHFVWVPTVHAWVALNHGDSEAAIRVLGPAVPYDRANVDPMLARADAFLQSKRLPEATEEFRRIISLRTRFPYDPACSLAQLGLARAYKLAGDMASSRAAYKDFLTLWKDADPDLPILRQAQAECAKLH